MKSDRSRPRRRNLTVALDAGNPKAMALYFDAGLFLTPDLIASCDEDETEDMDHHVVVGALEEPLWTDAGSLMGLAEFRLAVMLYWTKTDGELPELGAPEQVRALMRAEGFESKASLEALARLEIHKWPLVLPPAQGVGTTGSPAPPMLTLASLELVDTNKLSWRQLLELRTDAEALRKLRRLRLFMEDKYDGKSRAFIEDDLAQRIDDYHETVKSGGLETTLSSIGLLLGESAIVGSAVPAICSKLLGASVPEAVGIGTAIAIGRCVLEIGRKHHELQARLRRDQVAFLVHAQKLTS